MRPFNTFTTLFTLFISLEIVHAATAEQWKGKSIYQLITDRFAPPSDTAPALTSPLPSSCDPFLQTWCGGTWRSIIDKLDYIQGMGMDAIWISPVSKNIDVYTPYNYAYHGYWVVDPLQMNPRFGTEQDLHDLVTAVHDRGMYIMVDIVVNNIPSLTVAEATDGGALAAAGSRWTDPSQFHPQCWIDYNNQTSVEYCWLGDDKVSLMDVNTENQDVINTLQSWIYNFTTTYQIDGLRIDAAKHIPGVFWQGFCGAAGVFCIGEVYGDDLTFASSFQTQKFMDSVLGYPLYYGLTAGFGAPMGNMSHFVDIANQVLTAFPDPSVLGNFLENHDLPRWRNATVDPQLSYNALIAQFIFEGLPTVYYGQEQDFGDGAADPYNRQALWPSNYTNTSTYHHIASLNQIRHTLISNGTQFEGKSFLDYQSKIVASSQYDVAIRKGPLLAVLTNRGSPPQDASFGITLSGWQSQSSVVDILSCKQFTVGADQTVSVSYSEQGYGGMPYLLLSTEDAATLHICGLGGVFAYSSGQDNSTSKKGAAELTLASPTMSLFGTGVLVLVAAGAFGTLFV